MLAGPVGLVGTYTVVWSKQNWLVSVTTAFFWRSLAACYSGGVVLFFADCEIWPAIVRDTGPHWLTEVRSLNPGSEIAANFVLIMRGHCRLFIFRFIHFVGVVLA